MAPLTAIITTTTTANKLVPRAAKPRFKALARALLEQREFFKNLGQQVLTLNDNLLTENALLLAENARLQTRPEFAFTFAAGSGPSAPAAAAEEPLTSEQLDFNWDDWIDPAEFLPEVDSQNLEHLFAGETMPLPPADNGEDSNGGLMMTDDGAEVHRCRMEIADLTIRLESCQTQLASYEEQAQEYQTAAHSNERLKQELQQEKAQRQQVESSFEHFQLQYRNERSSLAAIVTPGLDFPDHQSVHEHVGHAIEQLRRDIATLSTIKQDVEAQLSATTAKVDEKNLLIQNLQQQNESTQAQLDANVAKFQDSLTVTEAQQAVSDAVADLSAQCEQAHLETDALKEENANQTEELENLRRFREQYSSPTARTHRRNPSSRPTSMVLGSTNLEDEISSAAVSGDEIDDNSLLQQQPQYQVLTLSDIMTVETAPTSPKQPTLGFSEILTEQVVPVSSTQPAFNFAAIMTQDMEPRSPSHSQPPHQPLVFSGIMTQEVAPVSPNLPVREFSPIMTQESEPQSPPKQALALSPLSLQSTVPKKPRKNYALLLPKPRVYSGNPPDVQAMLDEAARRPRMSPIMTVFEQAPIPSASAVHGSEKKATTSVATQADVPAARIHMSTSATVISLILALIFMLLVRLCATRFAFYNAMRTANTITDWHTSRRSYNIISYAPPYRPSLGIVIHDFIWGMVRMLLSIFGAGDKASLMHYRVATWWSGTSGLAFA